MNDQLIEVTVDGVPRAVPVGTPLSQVIPPEGAALAARVGDRLVDLSQPVSPDADVHPVTFADESGRHVFRHSSAHLLAQAVKRLWPDARLGTGPALEDGFYYDIWLPRPLSEGDLDRIEAAMREIVAEDLPIERLELSRDEARRIFSERGEPFKLEIIERIPDGATISAYRQGEFVDLCAGPHVPSTGRLKAIRLTSVSGAYWRGDESRPMLTRIYGTSFPSQDELDAHFARLEEAKRRDHRKLGRDLSLFMLKDEAPGFVFWEPKGVRLYRTLEQFSREVQDALGYEEIMTPWIYRAELWKVSGHWEHYRDNMFLIARDDEELGVKPMNCPGHCALFASQTRSYRDLPIKWADYSPLSRFERSGTLHGLLRVRGFHQDDAHLFIRPEQIEEQILELLELVDRVYRTFDMTVDIQFATRPEHYLGDRETWDEAERQLEAALRNSGRPFQLNPGDGAFYGPKLDFQITDALGRRWQTATVQLDFQLPHQFDLHYTDQDGTRRRPVMIHRAILGSLERFIGILLEHYAGALPLWLAPEQVRVLPVSDDQLAYAHQVRADLAAAGLFATVDGRREKLGYKIRAAQIEKVPVVLVIGKREAERREVAVRTREGDQGAEPWPAFREVIQSWARRPD
jgi:threonyl-tRNA synthetase